MSPGSHPARSASRSVLVVDDEKNIRTTLADILTDEGCRVSTAQTGEQAVKLCRHRPFDLVLLDVRMPGMDGFETFRVIRRHRSDVRVVMMSAYSTDQFQRVGKPVTSSSLSIEGWLPVRKSHPCSATGRS